jgi:hypothetical protein
MGVYRLALWWPVADSGDQLGKSAEVLQTFEFPPERRQRGLRLGELEQLLEPVHRSG